MEDVGVPEPSADGACCCQGTIPVSYCKRWKGSLRTEPSMMEDAVGMQNNTLGTGYEDAGALEPLR